MPPSSNEDSGVESRLTRRRLLMATSAGTAGALAGCSTSENPNTTKTTTKKDTTSEDKSETTTTTEQKAPPMAKTLVSPSQFKSPPNELQWHWLNQKQRPPGLLTWDALAATDYGNPDQLYYPELLESYNFDSKNQKFTVTLKDTKWWHVDRYVDSKDLWTMAMLQIGGRSRQVFKDFTKQFNMPDERTLELSLRDDVNPGLARTQFLTRTMNTPKEKYKKWAEKVWNARKSDGTWDEEELKAIQQDLLTWRIDEPHGNSLFKVEELSRKGITCSINQGHWAADKWEGMKSIEFPYATSQDRSLQMFVSGKSDMLGSDLPDSLESQAPKSAKKYEYVRSTGWSLAPSYKVEPWGNIKVRKAMMHLLDRKAISNNVGDGAVHDEIITGMSSVTEPRYIPDDMLAKFPKYETDREKAANLLREAGLTKDGDWWKLSDGSVWEPKINTFSGGTKLVVSAKTATSQMRSFGIKAQLNVMSPGKYWGNLFTNEKFETMVATYGGWRIYPLNGFSADMGEGYGDRWDFPGAETENGRIKVPMPIGDPSGTEEWVYPPKLFEAITNSSDEEENAKRFQKLAWTYAMTLPTLPWFHNNNISWMTHDHWDMPTPDSKHGQMKAPGNHYPAAGLMKPKRQK